MANQLQFAVNVDTNAAVGSINQFFQTFEQNAASASRKLRQDLGEPIQKEVIITMKGGEAVAQVTKNMNDNASKLRSVTQALNGEFGKTPAALRQQLDLLKALQQNTQKYSSTTGKVTQDWKLVEQAIRKAQQQMNGFKPGPIQAIGDAIQGTIGKFVAVQTISNLATGAIQALAAGFAQAIMEGAKMEVLQLQLEAFTGSAQNAEMAMKAFTETAIKTPFNIQQVADAGRILMGFGVSVDEAIAATDKLAIAASATSGDLSNMARNLGQIQAQGRAYTRDLTQFAIQGIPIWTAMSEVTGKSTEQLKKMAEEGAISFDTVKAALGNLTREGSAFAELADRMQNTFTGRMEQIGSSILMASAAFLQMIQSYDASTGRITALFQTIKGLIDGLAAGFIFISQNMGEIIKLMGTAATATGTFLAVANFGQLVQIVGKFITLWRTYISLQKVIAAGEAVIAALRGNWVGIAAAAVAGGVAYGFLNKMIEDNEKKEAAAAAAREKSTKKMEEQKARMEELISQYGEVKGRVLAYQEQMAELKQQYENGEITAKQYTEALGVIRDNLKALMGDADGTKQKIEELNAAMEQIKNQKETANRGFDDETKAVERRKRANDRAHEDTISNLNKEKDAIKDKEDAAVKQIEAREKAEDRRHEAAMRNIEAEGKRIEKWYDAAIAATKEQGEQKISNLEKEKEAATASGEIAVQNIERQKQAEQSRHQMAMANIQKQGEDRMNSLNREKAKIDEITNAQLDAARRLSPAEKELADIRRKKLEDTARNTSLSREERLEAQAQLDSMERQKYETEIQKWNKEQQKKIDEQITLEKQKQAAIEQKAEQDFQNKLLMYDQQIEKIRQITESNVQGITTQIEKERQQTEERIKQLEQQKEAEKEKNDQAKQQEKDRHDAVKQQLEDQKEAIKSKAETDIKAIDDAIEKEKERKKQQDRDFEDELQSIKDRKEAYNRAADDRLKQLQKEKDKLKETKEAVAKVKDEVDLVKSAYDNVVKTIQGAIDKTKELQRETAKIKPGGGGNGGTSSGSSGSSGGYQSSAQRLWNWITGGAKFAGGPVSGGQAYTVNEFGKEAFLSAAGKLSMINAPSFGTWRAPSSGTVIPAHLTSQLSIPSGGVRVNTGVSSRGDTTGMAVARAIRGLSDGMNNGNVTNNVTVQSANTTKTASDLLVQLTKIRRRRYS